MTKRRDARRHHSHHHTHHNSFLFNSFVVTVVLAHLTQLVWNLPHPFLLEKKSPPTVKGLEGSRDIISPFDDPDDSSSSEVEVRSEGSSASSRPGRNNKETREIHDRQIEVSSYCSLLQTILDPRNCRSHHQHPRHFQFEDSSESFTDGGGHEESLLESNNIVPPHPPPGSSSQRGEFYPYHLQPPQQQNHPHGSFLPPPPPPPSDNEEDGDIRLLENSHHHHHNNGLPPQHIPLDENGNEDETKIIRSKTMIIVPERTCPPGKRRDIRGYCRTVYRFTPPPPPYGNHPPPPRGSNSGPVRLYYRRYVAVPTLHFLLP